MPGALGLYFLLPADQTLLCHEDHSFLHFTLLSTPLTFHPQLCFIFLQSSYCKIHYILLPAFQRAPRLSILFTEESTASRALLVTNTQLPLVEQIQIGWVSCQPSWLSQANPRKKPKPSSASLQNLLCFTERQMDQNYLQQNAFKLQTTCIAQRPSGCCKLNFEMTLVVSSFVLEDEELGWDLTPPSSWWQVTLIPYK